MKKLLEKMEKLQRPSGAFIAAPTPDYQACWLRDHLYISFSYYYINEFEKLKRGLWVAFDILHKYRWKIERVICSPPNDIHNYLHAKYNPDTFEEVTKEWGHHQLDVLGLFLHIVADLDFKNIALIRNKNDSEIIQLLVFYLLSVKYWEKPDNGMWEENLDLHPGNKSSSIGAALAGLFYIKRRQMAVVPELMITLGRETLNNLLPNESPNHDVDMAQLSLIWPYNVISRETADTILRKVREKLVQKHGLNRYWGDNYYKSRNGISGEWPMGFFWLSIVASQRHNVEEAKFWFEKGIAEMTSKGEIPEIYQDDRPNEHTPLAWAHAMAIIAKAKLKQENHNHNKKAV